MIASSWDLNNLGTGMLEYSASYRPLPLAKQNAFVYGGGNFQSELPNPKMPNFKLLRLLNNFYFYFLTIFRIKISRRFRKKRDILNILTFEQAIGIESLPQLIAVKYAKRHD